MQLTPRAPPTQAPNPPSTVLEYHLPRHPYNTCRELMTRVVTGVGTDRGQRAKRAANICYQYESKRPRRHVYPRALKSFAVQHQLHARHDRASKLKATP